MRKLKKVLSLALAALIAASCSFVAVYALDPQAKRESEPNDDASNADYFPIGNEIGGVLSAINDEDWYYFEVAKPGVAFASLLHNAKVGSDQNASYFKITVYDARNRVATAFKSAGADKRSDSDVFAVSPGKYYVKVAAGNVYDSTLDYSVTADIDSEAIVEVEPNDVPQSAAFLQLEKSDGKKYYADIIGNINDETDVDYFSFRAPCPGVLWFCLYNGNVERGDYELTLLKYVDKGEAKLKNLGSIAASKRDEYRMSPAVGIDGGEYLLKANGLGGSTGAYEVIAIFVLDDESEYEYNGEPRDANVLFVNSRIIGSTFDENDVDYFKFNVPKENYGYEITVSAFDEETLKKNGKWIIASILDQDGKATDKDGEIIARNVAATGGAPAKISTGVLTAGVYYIKIKAGDEVNDGNYELKLETKPKPEEPPSAPNLWRLFLQALKKFYENNLKELMGNIQKDLLPMLTSIVSSVVKLIKSLIAGEK